jgi:hypothetical protein
MEFSVCWGGSVGRQLYRLQTGVDYLICLPVNIFAGVSRASNQPREPIPTMASSCKTPREGARFFKTREYSVFHCQVV